MSDTVQTGHEHAGSRAAVITLSTPMLEEVGEGRVQALVAAIVDLVRTGRDHDHVKAGLGEVLRRNGVAQPEPVVARMAENIFHADDVIVATDDGRVLHGDPSWSPATANPDVEGTEDPMHGDRPTYS